MLTIGQKVRAINNQPLKGNDAAPDLELGKEYEVKNIFLDSGKNPHIDVGLPSNLNYIRSYETRENLPDGDKIHWCHPSRFEVI